MNKKYPDPLLTKRWLIISPSYFIYNEYIIYHDGSIEEASEKAESLIGQSVELKEAPWSSEKIVIYDGRAAPGS